MNKSLLDSALVVALGTGLLYVYGLIWSTGSTTVLAVPNGALRMDFTDTAAIGARMMIGAILMPFLIYRDGVWHIGLLTIALIGAVIGFVVWRIFRGWKYRSVTLVLWGVLYIGGLTLAFAVDQAHQFLVKAKHCLATNNCRSVSVAELLAIGSGEQVLKRSGVIYTLASENVIVLTTSGIVVVPRSSLRAIDFKNIDALSDPSP